MGWVSGQKATCTGNLGTRDKGSVRRHFFSKVEGAGPGPSTPSQALPVGGAALLSPSLAPAPAGLQGGRARPPLPLFLSLAPAPTASVLRRAPGRGGVACPPPRLLPVPTPPADPQLEPRPSPARSMGPGLEPDLETGLGVGGMRVGAHAVAPPAGSRAPGPAPTRSRGAGAGSEPPSRTLAQGSSVSRFPGEAGGPGRTRRARGGLAPAPLSRGPCAPGPVRRGRPEHSSAGHPASSISHVLRALAHGHRALSHVSQPTRPPPAPPRPAVAARSAAARAALRTAVSPRPRRPAAP